MRFVDFGFDCNDFARWIPSSDASKFWLNSFEAALSYLGIDATGFSARQPYRMDSRFAFFGSSTGNLCRLDLGEFRTSNGAVYRAIGLAVPKNPNDLTGPHQVYLRSKTETNWTLFDDETNSWNDAITNYSLSTKKASAILYLRIDPGFPFCPDDVFERFQFAADPTLPLIPAAIRLRNGIIGPSEDEEITDYDFDFMNTWNTAKRDNLFIPSAVARHFDRNMVWEDFDDLFRSLLRKLSYKADMVYSPDQFPTVTGKTAVFFTQSKYKLGNAAFMNNQGKHFRAITFSVPKYATEPTGPQLVYSRDVYGNFWKCYDDEPGAAVPKRIAVPHSEVTLLSPSIIVYSVVNNIWNFK